MKLLKMLAIVALALSSWATQAGPFFATKDGSVVWDQATGLVWMRCSLGQVWDGSTCSGSATTNTFDKAQAAVRTLNDSGGWGGFSDWQMPTVRQLASIRWCSRGFTEKTTDLQDGDVPVPERCFSGVRQPTALEYVFPSAIPAGYWASSPGADNKSYVRFVGFNNGLVGFNHRGDSDNLLRLVRASGGEAVLAFPVNLTDQQEAKEKQELIQREAREKQERIEREAREKQERIEHDAKEKRERLEREAATKKAEADERAAQTAAIRKGPQQLYLLAGQSQRGKSIEINGRSFGTIELYELIVEKFPSSEYAVRASDQLNAMDRSERAQSASYRAAEAQRRADQNASNRAQCFSNVRSCEANCASSWSRDYRMAQSCISGCQRTCN